MDSEDMECDADGPCPLLNLQSLIFQLHSLSTSEAEFLLAGITAQIKAHAGIVLQHVVADVIRIMGGIGWTKGGHGERVERIWRDVKALTVPGGSEEVMLDLAARRAVKAYEELDKAESAVNVWFVGGCLSEVSTEASWQEPLTGAVGATNPSALLLAPGSQTKLFPGFFFHAQRINANCQQSGS